MLSGSKVVAMGKATHMKQCATPCRQPKQAHPQPSTGHPPTSRAAETRRTGTVDGRWERTCDDGREALDRDMQRGATEGRWCADRMPSKTVCDGKKQTGLVQWCCTADKQMLFRQRWRRTAPRPVPLPPQKGIHTTLYFPPIDEQRRLDCDVQALD